MSGLKDTLIPDPAAESQKIEEEETASVEEQDEPAEPVEEPSQEDLDESPTEEVEKPADEEKQPKPVEGETARERALRKEVEELKRERREAQLKPREVPVLSVKAEDTETEETVTRGEAIILNSLQDEAFEAFLAEHPIYRSDDKKWEAFLAEYKDRKSIVSVAKEQGKSPSKSMFKTRLESIHRSIFGGNDPDAEAQKRAKTSTRAAIALRQSQGGSPSSNTAPKAPSLLPKPSGISTWVSKK